MGFKVNLCSSVYPDRMTTLKRVGIDVTDSIDSFLKAIPRNEILPFLGAYQRLCYSYFFFKKLIQQYSPDFVLVTGGSSLIPKAEQKRLLSMFIFQLTLKLLVNDTSIIDSKEYTSGHGSLSQITLII